MRKVQKIQISIKQLLLGNWLHGWEGKTLTGYKGLLPSCENLHFQFQLLRLPLPVMDQAR